MWSLNCVACDREPHGAYKSMWDATETAWGEHVAAWDPDTGILFLAIERAVIKRSRVTVVICPSLEEIVRKIDPKAAVPTAGSGDFCLIAGVSLEQAFAHIQACGVTIEEGPAPRTGATGTIRSIYFRDPDGHLLELATPGLWSVY